MSHNSKSYRKKITDSTGAKCAKIDILFKQHALSKENNVTDAAISPGQDDQVDTVMGSPAPTDAEIASATDIDDNVSVKNLILYTE